MSTIQEVIHHEVNRAMARHPGLKAATITAYDPNRHAIKAMLQPDQIETGWFPINVPHVGNGFGIIAGPAVGDQITVGFLGGDMESPVHMGRIHSDQEQPPVAQSGEIIVKHKTGVTLKIDQNGNVSLDASGKNVSVTMQNLTVTGDVDINGGYLKHHGHDVGFTHRHIDTMPGSGLSGVPQ